MPHLSVYAMIAQAIAAVFALAGIVQLPGPGFVRRAYARWEMPRKFYRVVGVLDLIAAFFLMDASTRIWGVGLAAIVSFGAIVTLLKSEQYVWSIPGVVLMMALVPASLASPI